MRKNLFTKEEGSMSGKKSLKALQPYIYIYIGSSKKSKGEYHHMTEFW